MRSIPLGRIFLGSKHDDDEEQHHHSGVDDDLSHGDERRVELNV